MRKNHVYINKRKRGKIEMKKEKRGISLIVLVITIIVMIILAGAIILSLNSSGIIGRANEARNKSDMTNKKEAVGMFAAEYEMKAGTGEIDRNVVKVNDYVKQRLEEEGMETSDVYVTEQGEILIGSGAKAAKAGVQVGATVEGYVVESKSYTTDGKEYQWDGDNMKKSDPKPQTVANKTDFTWKYIGNDKNGNMLITPDVSGNISTWPTIGLAAEEGYLYGPDLLNTICDALYTTDKGTARSMNIDDVTNLLGYTKIKGNYYDKSNKRIETEKALTIGEIGELLNSQLTRTKTPDGKDSWDDISKYKSDYLYITKTDSNITKEEGKALVYPVGSYYWLASPCVDAYFDDSIAGFYVRVVISSSVDAYDMFYSGGDADSYAYALRPVVLLTSDVEISYDAETNTCTIN